MSDQVNKEYVDGQKVSLGQLVDLIDKGANLVAQPGGTDHVSRLARSCSDEVLSYTLKWIDHKMASLEGTDHERNTPEWHNYLTTWYELIYDELEYRKALDLLAANVV